MSKKDKGCYIFEDKDAKNLSPISTTRSTFEVHCGTFTSLQRIKKFFPKAEIFCDRSVAYTLNLLDLIYEF